MSWKESHGSVTWLKSYDSEIVRRKSHGEKGHGWTHRCAQDMVKFREKDHRSRQHNGSEVARKSSHGGDKVRDEPHRHDSEKCHARGNDDAWAVEPRQKKENHGGRTRGS